LPIIDEAQGERLAGDAVSKRLREGKEAQRLSVSARAVWRSASEAPLDRNMILSFSPLRLKLISTV
jgi:hypothetical protein